MLGDIARVMSEVVMERFAPTEQRFTPDYARDAATLYQRLAFLQNLIAGEVFEAAVGQVLGRPHRGWSSVHEQRPPGRGVPGGSDVARQIVRAGPRLPSGLELPSSWPAHFDVEKQEETLDTPPNRFVKFALERWRDVVVAIMNALRAEQHSSGPVERGIREASLLLLRLEGILYQPLFREVGDLTHFPAGDQVLQKREGYRELLRAYIEFEVASKLAWSGGEEVYGAGQRDVATLYEYWAFFQLVRIVATVCEVPFDLERLVEVRPDGLAIDLHRGRDRVLVGGVSRLGRSLRVELWFNREFRKTSSSGGTWSRSMRPDYSVRISAVAKEISGTNQPDDVWLHFDAKYRVDAVSEIVGADAQTITSHDNGDLAEGIGVAKVDAQGVGRAKASDLLKMHAYRDAIRRSAGAYVLYPGSEPKDFREYHEILPGLGAFALRPMPSGGVEGEAPLARFIQDVMVHVASQLTQHERSRYWESRSFAPSTRTEVHLRAADFLPRPPADTLVLLGYMRGARHREWIRSKRLYNLRAGRRRGSVGLGSRELAADVVALYGDEFDDVELWQVSGEPQILTREQMHAMDYPSPRGDAYYCLPLTPIDEGTWRDEEFAHRVRAARETLGRDKPYGSPVTTTWQELILAGETEDH
jgi:hypothetical protein